MRFGLRTRRLFPRPLQRTVRFELFGTLAAESLSPFFEKKKGGVKETNNDVLRPEPTRRFLHMCTDGKAETGGENRVETGSCPNSDRKLWQGPKVMYVCNDMISIAVCMYVCVHVYVCMYICMYVCM